MQAWKIAAAAGSLGALGLIAMAVSRRDSAPTPRRIALIGDSYAVGLGPELAKLFPDFRYEGHVGVNSAQWASHGSTCGECGDWLTGFKPDTVLVSLGVNDTSPRKESYQAIVRTLHGIGARVVWIKPPLARATAAVLGAIASTGVPTVPATTTPLAADGLHPVSYNPWAREITQVVARV